MVEGLGSRVEVDVEGGAFGVCEVGYECRAEGRLTRELDICPVWKLFRIVLTFPAPAGPITSTPNFDIVVLLSWLCVDYGILGLF